MYILICDDEPAVARQVEQLARQHLEQRGIPVQCAVCTRGEEVLARSDLAAQAAEPGAGAGVHFSLSGVCS